MPRSSCFTARKVTQYPLCRSLGGSQGRSEWVYKILSPPGFNPQTIQYVALKLQKIWKWNLVVLVHTKNVHHVLSFFICQVSQDGSGSMDTESGPDDKGRELSHVCYIHTKSAAYLAFHITIKGIFCLRKNCQVISPKTPIWSEVKDAGGYISTLPNVIIVWFFCFGTALPCLCQASFYFTRISDLNFFVKVGWWDM